MLTKKFRKLSALSRDPQIEQSTRTKHKKYCENFLENVVPRKLLPLPILKVIAEAEAVENNSEIARHYGLASRWSVAGDVTKECYSTAS